MPLAELSIKTITDMIQGFIAEPENNRLRPGLDEPAWQEPLVGVAAGDDPIFAEIKGHVGDFFWLPQEAFSIFLGGQAVSAAELSVIAWVLPQTKATKDENAREKVYPGKRWASTRLYGEMINDALRKYVVARLEGMGLDAVAPPLMPEWGGHQSPDYGYASSWSERHAAHAAGLGTFGLCDGLITAKGKAIRAGSVLVRAEVPATPRPYDNHRAYCLHYTHDSCRKCIERCPVNALSLQGHDKVKCRRHLYDNVKPYVQKNYDLEIYGCGLCQVGVPCSDGIPTPDMG